MIGIDIVETQRFKDKSQSFFDKLFTKNEQEYIASKKFSLETMAGIFAAKEAVLKALQVGISGGFLNIEIGHLNSGAPCVSLFGRLKEMASGNIEVSISHTKSLATAIVYIG